MSAQPFSSHDKFIGAKGFKIYYTDTNASNSDILFFVHGNSSSHRSWDSQVCADVFKNFRMITFDLPGHGKSSSSNNPFDDYSVVGTAAILAVAVKQLALNNKYFLVGFCYGSNIIAEMLSDKEILPAGVVFLSTNVLGAQVPLENVFKQPEKLTVLFKDQCHDNEIRHLWESEGIDNDRMEILVDDHLAVDNKFRSTLAETVVAKKYSNEIEIIQQSGTPVLVIFGEHDPLVNVDYLDGYVPGWNIVKLKDKRHLMHITAASKVNELIARFCSNL